ncbi:hypothetical protein [Phyllobacterium sp. P5_D12]
MRPQLPLTDAIKAAEHGNTEAQYNIGVMCSKGKGVPKDDAQAVRWW